MKKEEAIEIINTSNLFWSRPNDKECIALNMAIEALEQMPYAQTERLTDDEVETIRIHLNACKEKLCNQQRWEEAEEYQRIIDRFMSFASAQPGWIPVTERLPEEKDAGILKKLGIEKRSEYVLATAEVKGERMTVTACTHDGKWDWKMKHAFPDFKVVAWMPLPEPYKGGE